LQLRLVIAIDAYAHTPGQTDDSFCYFLEHQGRRAVFTADALLVRGTRLPWLAPF
jgi:glyoxylase-like metal-dependent hydrolase (beta-lactamase superfamily II)